MNTLDTVIIGSGPGGYVAAIRASQLGQKVTLIEKADIGGTCLNVGCVPSKALLNIGHHLRGLKDLNSFGIEINDSKFDFEKAQKFKDQRVVKKLRLGITGLLQKNKVEVINGVADFTSSNSIEVTSNGEKTAYSFKNAIIAVGGRPVELKFLPKDERILDSSSALNLKELPKSMIVIGAGYIGSELSEAYANLGTKITLIEGTPNILPGFSTDLSSLVAKNFKKLGIDVITDAMVESAEIIDNQVSLKYKHNNEVKIVVADYALVSVGRRPNTDQLSLDKAKVELKEKGLIKVDLQSRTTNPNIYAIGDVTEGLALAHKASYEAKIVAEVISGSKNIIDYKCIPAVCYTTPEISSVGLSLDEAKAKGLKAKSTDFPFQANSRSIASGETEGYVRLISEEETELLLGAQIVGAQASELITNCGLAIENSLTLEDIALTIFPHPSFAESIMDNAEIGLGYPIHL